MDLTFIGAVKSAQSLLDEWSKSLEQNYPMKLGTRYAVFVLSIADLCTN
jgi:hypothetical protein